MPVGPHYYVISFGRQTIRLFEAFRDTLIDIQHNGFPVEVPGGTLDASNADEQLLGILRRVDDCFAGHYKEEPLEVVLVGEAEMVAVFLSLTAHRHAIVDHIEGDYSGTSSHDLGRIVWPLVKEHMSGLQERAMQDLENAEHKGQIAFGIDSVSQSASEGIGKILLVERDYHMRGSILAVGPSVTVSPDVNVMEVMDDVVDIVIEKVRRIGGNVVFVPDGSLERLKKIVLLLNE